MRLFIIVFTSLFLCGVAKKDEDWPARDFVASYIVAAFNKNLVRDLEFMVCEGADSSLCTNYLHVVDDIVYKYETRKIKSENKFERVEALIRHITRGLDEGVIRIDRADFYVNGGVYFEGFNMEFRNDRPHL